MFKLFDWLFQDPMKTEVIQEDDNISTAMQKSNQLKGCAGAARFCNAPA